MQGLGIPKRWRLLGFVAIIAAILSIGAIACSSDDDEDGGDATATQEQTPSATESNETPTEGVAGQLDLTALEFKFENIPASQPGGLTTITLDNIGGEDHQVQLIRLNDGVTLDQFSEALNSDPSGAAALAQGTVAGGANNVVAGTKGEVVQDLAEGNYALICFFSGADDVPHFAKGMLAPLTVTAPPAEQPAPPTEDANIAAADFEFTGDLTLTAGEHTVKLTNNGPQVHEMAIEKLQEGFTVDMLKALFTEEEPTPEPGVTPEEQGPPPFSAAAGIGAIMPNTVSYTTLNLEAGNYAILCFVPDQTTGAPHAALGMVTALTVQ